MLSGEYFNKAGNNGFSVLHVRHASPAPTNRVFAAVVEPYVGEPFLESVRLLAVADNDADARKAVAVEVKTKNGHTDWLFADGRPGNARVIGGVASGVRVSGEFATLSRDGEGLRLAALTGGTRLDAPEVRLLTACASYTGTVRAVRYPDKQIELDTAWPAGRLLQGRVFEIGTGAHRTTCTVAGSERVGDGTRVTVTRGAEFYLGRVRAVDSDKGQVYANLGPAFLGGAVIPGLDRHWVASDEAGTRFWRAAYRGRDAESENYLFHLTGAPVAEKDFGRLQGFRLWWYGEGDTVRMTTRTSLRRVEAGLYELSADTAVTLGLKAGTLELSRDGVQWTRLTIRSEAGLAVAEVGLEQLDDAGRAFIRVGSPRP